jgi:hypothetical protein
VAVVARSSGAEPLIVTDTPEGLQMLVDKRAPAPVVAAPDATRLYEVPGTPYAVFLDAAGIVRAKGTVNNLEQMEGLADTAARRVKTIDEHRRAG